MNTRWSRDTRGHLVRVCVLVAVLLWTGADRAAAHTKLVRTAADARAVTLTFSSPVPARLTEINVLAARGEELALGQPGNVARDPTSVTLPIRGELAGGKYFVTWSTADDDGHVVSGVFDFELRSAAAPRGASPRSPPPASAPTAPSAPAATVAALSLARIAQDAALTLGFGLVVFLGFVWRRGAGVAALRSGITIRLQALLVGAAAVGAGSAAAALLLQSAVVGRALPWTAAALAPLPDVVGSRAGGSWAFVTAVWLGLLVAARRRPEGAVLAGLAALLILTPPLRGHAGDGPLAAAVVVHVAAVGAWIGGLVALLVTVGGSAAGVALREHVTVVAGVVERFGTVALPCALAVFATGALQAIGALDGLEQLATTGYGRVIAVKLALSLGLIALGARSRQALVGRLRRQRGGAGAIALMRATVAMELALAALALAAAGLLAGMAPPG